MSSGQGANIGDGSSEHFRESGNGRSEE